MARLARIVIPGIPHHVTQRGNRRATVFWGDDDYAAYLDLVKEAAIQVGSEIWAYCLMPNHVHMIVVPRDEKGLRGLFADVHRQYTRRINARNKWTGHLWQGRFGPVAMDEAHLVNAIRYVSLNPVRAGLVKKAEDWPWSSVRAHLGLEHNTLVKVDPVQQRMPDFSGQLIVGEHEEMWERLRKAETTGRPIGDKAWLEQMENRTGRALRPKKRGRKRDHADKSKPSP